MELQYLYLFSAPNTYICIQTQIKPNVGLA